VREQVVVLPASERPATQQKNILGELVKDSRLLPDSGEEAVTEEERTPVVLPAGEGKPKDATTREVLGGLLGKKEPTDVHDETDSTDSEQ